MVETINDKKGRCVAYLEWALVDNKGIIDDNGTYIFVKELWIWKGVKHGYKIMRGFIKDLGTKFPNATHTYWKRKKYNGIVKTYNRRVIYG